MNWQPIETAPRDGRRIIVSLWSGMHCYWVHDATCKPPDKSFSYEKISGHQVIKSYLSPSHWVPLTQPDRDTAGQ